MSASYTFIPWARQGLANRITATDLDATVQLRADVDVALELSVHQLDGTDQVQDLPPRKVQLYGPGDVIGIDSRAIVRTEPHDWITNFEPNYLASIEFYDEDLPWRYTPAAPDANGARLRPWIMLAVLAEDEAGPGKTDKPLPSITLTDAAYVNAMPDPATLWAWAHVHVNRRITTGDTDVVSLDRDAVATRLAATVDENADLAYSRIICPRRLQPNKTYYAFLLPVFETGRLAGLGLDPGASPNATACSWTSNGADKNSFPVYHRWQFRTGMLGDFESLVRMLQPKPVDKRVGVRPMDVQRPGANLPGIDDAALAGVLQLGGALRVPRSSLNAEELAAAQAQEDWDEPYPHPFQTRLAAFVNLADDYANMPPAAANANPDAVGVAPNQDPVITPPLYGRWHAQTSRLLRTAGGGALGNTGNWVHELNLDPRYRVAAGFGTRVVQAQQEDLMASAWEQVGDVLEANKRMRRLQLSREVATVWHRGDLATVARISPGKAMMLTGPVQGRILSGDVTLRTQVAASAVPLAVVAPTMRRLARPGTGLMRSLPLSRAVHANNLVERVNSGEVAPAPPKVVPPGVVTVDSVAAAALPPGLPGWLLEVLRGPEWVALVPAAIGLLLALVMLVLGLGWLAALAILAIGASLGRLAKSVAVADGLGEDNQTPAAVNDLPASPDFTVAPPAAGAPAVTLVPGGTDGAQARRFKAALADVGRVVEASRSADKVGENGPPRPPLELQGTLDRTLSAIDPSLTVARLAAAQLKVPPRISNDMRFPFAEAMAYPVFDIPMYGPLKDISAELLIPNINYVETNSVTLLETNQKFIESYMVGLNHEFARELLWREYPTDQRGSYFRQFWDVSSFLSATPDDPALRERLRDIPPIHRWASLSKLGEHDARERPGDNEEEVVLVIRGELLKRYPNAVVYAQAAEWQMTAGGIDPAKERTLVEVSEAEEGTAPRDKLRTPLYQAKIEPDIYFFGFDLTVPAARGGAGTAAGDPPGWFFVIRERPGEPRFGFDETSNDNIVVYNDLGWDRVPLAGQFVRPLGGAVPPMPTGVPAGEEEKEEQRVEDRQVQWGNDVTAAELAYIMYQAPAMVAIHAAEMLVRT